MYLIYQQWMPMNPTSVIGIFILSFPINRKQTKSNYSESDIYRTRVNKKVFYKVGFDFFEPKEGDNRSKRNKERRDPHLRDFGPGCYHNREQMAFQRQLSRTPIRVHTLSLLLTNTHTHTHAHPLSQTHTPSLSLSLTHTSIHTPTCISCIF